MENLKILGNIIEKIGPSLAVFFVGAAFFAIGIFAEVPGTAIHIDGQLQQYTLSIAGIISMCFGGFMLVRESQKTNIDRVVKKLGFSISHPSRNAAVDNPLVFSGALKKKIPQGYQIWAVHVFSKADGEEYFPQEPVEEIDATTLIWSLKYKAYSQEQLKNIKIQFLLVGKDGQIFVKFYKMANNALASDGQWKGIKTLTSDMVRLGEPHPLTVKIGEPAALPRLKSLS